MKKNLYLILPILIIICLLSFAAVCNLGQSQSSEETADQLSKEEELQKELAALEKENEQNSKDTKNTDDNKEESTEKKDEKPAVALKIYEGPTYSKSDDVCYYRIEAKITGAPSPVIKFSRDDSNGALGNTKIQINLKKGETYTLSVTATNSEGTANDSIKLTWGCNGSNHAPVIAGIGISANDLYTLTEYEISAAATDADGDPLTYKWSVDGGVLSDPDANPTKWETPGFPETYHITVEVSDGKGGTDTETLPVRVDEIVIIGGSPPKIHDITINQFPLYVDSKYYVYGDVTDPDNDLAFFQFNVSGGTLSDRSANTAYWTTPADAGDYTVSLTVWDNEGHEDMLIVFFNIIEKEKMK
ncbi:MAG TPA: hypothetical protein DCP02_02825 [Actinobacteria bacterium]|nr:hypothetical protein [Actinomycetota bacterium]